MAVLNISMRGWVTTGIFEMVTRTSDRVGDCNSVVQSIVNGAGISSSSLSLSLSHFQACTFPGR